MVVHSVPSRPDVTRRPDLRPAARSQVRSHVRAMSLARSADRCVRDSRSRTSWSRGRASATRSIRLLRTGNGTGGAVWRRLPTGRSTS